MILSGHLANQFYKFHIPMSIYIYIYQDRGKNISIYTKVKREFKNYLCLSELHELKALLEYKTQLDTRMFFSRS